MSVPFPNYFEFDSINPAYQLDPETIDHLIFSWEYMTHESTISKKAPEGLIVPNGVTGIMERMKEVRYLAIVPKELAEEIRQVMVSYIRHPDASRERIRPDENQLRTDRHPMQECPPNIDDVIREERPEDPFPELPCPWPWELDDFDESERPFSGRIRSPYRIQIVNQGTRLINYIFTYDYCGQYYGSAESFCRHMEDIPGKNNYSVSLRRLNDSVASNGDAPLIVLCPENIAKFVSRLNIPSNLYSKTQLTPKEKYIFGLKKVLIHEMGHHMFPIVTYNYDERTVYWPECMANWFAYHFLDKYERFLLHIWSLKQSVQYQCYKALLGLSMRNVAHEFLSIIPPTLRRSVIVDAETVCGYNYTMNSLSYIGRRGRLFLGPDLIMELHKLSRATHNNANGFNIVHPVLLTHSEALFKLLVSENQYMGIFDDFQHMISRGIIIAHQASKGEYHNMLLDEGKRKPISVGSTRL